MSGIAINPLILDTIVDNNNMITTAQVLELGFTRSLLSKYVKAGLLERESQGVYVLPDALHDEMHTFMLRSKKMVFSHETAAFLNGLSERIPFEYAVTIPSNTKISSVLSKGCICYYIKPELYQVGIVVRKTVFGNEVRCYNSERTVCDLLRSRNRLDEELVISVIKKYAVSAQKDLNLLAEFAKKFGVEKTIRRYLEVLL